LRSLERPSILGFLWMQRQGNHVLAEDGRVWR